MDQTAAKQQIVERIKQANNILVTVSNNPSVDQLAACIGLTLLLNRMGKHATAVYSGTTPSTIEFLQPEKTLETNTDSLQDFIISLDKAKADKLRYKVEDQVVRIFITPYKTKITEQDLVFSHGDFNVEVVMALGVKDRSQIDTAIAAHGRILHDATAVSLNAGKDSAANLGQINWQDETASSLSEMVVSISEAFGSGLIDNQMATAFLTGIVAETERFSNTKTSPKVMTMSAQLMAAGANQQLISAKLEPPAQPVSIAKTPAQPSKPAGKDNGTLVIEHQEPKKDQLSKKPPPKPAEAKKEEPEIDLDSDGSQIIIDEQGNLQTLERQSKPAEPEPRPEPEPPPLPPELPPEPPPAESFEETLAAKPEPPPPKTEPPAATKPPPFHPPEAGGHDLLQPRDGHEEEDGGGPFAANVRPAWAAYENLSADPLGDHTHSAVVKKSGVDDGLDGAQPADLASRARDSVKSALDSKPFVPDFQPIQSLGAGGELDVQPEAPTPPPSNINLGTPTQAHDDNPTPVLPLPTNGLRPPIGPGSGLPISPPEPSKLSDKDEKPSAPPMPPPLMMPPSTAYTPPGPSRQ